MSKVFPKLAKAITLAAKEGGMDPEMNAKLRTAIQNAKGENMPKDNIENAIKRAEAKDAENYVEVNYEGKGPHGVLVFVECATDNTTRTVANIKSYFNKAGGGIVPNGSLEFMFNRRAVFEFEIPDGMDVCHSCDNRSCVNPDHLFIGTRKENMQDMKLKGRGAGGCRKHLREDQVQEVRRRLAVGIPHSEISKNMNINRQTVTKIQKGESYVGIGK